MGSSDVPPPSAPSWLIPASTALLSSGIFFWLVSYVLMTRRSLATGATPLPLFALGLNLAWEVVYAVMVTDTALERVGFALWLLFDLPVLFATLSTARRSFAASPLIGHHPGLALAASFSLGLVGNVVFALWWLQEPHRGSGDKTGKAWKGLQARDTTELAWWSAGVAQMILSVSAVVMLLQRGHSGGQSYAIWFCRFIGTQLGLPACCALLWWYWPQAHGFVFHPLSLFIVGTSIVCDVMYPFLLAYVRTIETVLVDGTITAGDGPSDRKTK